MMVFVIKSRATLKFETTNDIHNFFDDLMKYSLSDVECCGDLVSLVYNDSQLETFVNWMRFDK